MGRSTAGQPVRRGFCFPQHSPTVRKHLDRQTLLSWPIFWSVPPATPTRGRVLTPTSSPRATKYLRQPPNLRPLPQHLPGQPQKPTTHPNTSRLQGADTAALTCLSKADSEPCSCQHRPFSAPMVAQRPLAAILVLREGAGSAILGQRLGGPAWLRPWVTP